MRTVHVTLWMLSCLDHWDVALFSTHARDAENARLDNNKAETFCRMRLSWGTSSLLHLAH